MRSNYKIQEDTLSEIRSYINGLEQAGIRKALSSAQSVLRAVMSRNINSHPKLLLVYNQFNKLKEITEQHISRKEHFLFPFLKQLIDEGQLDPVANTKVAGSFFSVFAAENDKITGIINVLTEAAGDYRTDNNTSPAVKTAFRELQALSGLLGELVEKENKLYVTIQGNESPFNTKTK